jgi:hypothetical protein
MYINILKTIAALTSMNGIFSKLFKKKLRNFNFHFYGNVNILHNWLRLQSFYTINTVASFLSTSDCWHLHVHVVCIILFYMFTLYCTTFCWFDSPHKKWLWRMSSSVAKGYDCHPSSSVAKGYDCHPLSSPVAVLHICILSWGEMNVMYWVA